jgi:invasion protein IalB
MDERITDMRRTNIALTLLITLGLAAPSWAQDTTTTEQPAAPAPSEAPAATPEAGAAPADPTVSMGETVNKVGETYTAANFDDWEQKCVRVEDGSDPCQLYQLLKDAEGNSVAEISMLALPDGGKAAAGATIITPLETLLTQQLTLAVDSSEPKRYPFTFCAAIGCIARVGFTAAEIESFKKGVKATITIVPVAAPDKTVALNVSLKGFTAGYDAVNKANAKK